MYNINSSYNEKINYDNLKLIDHDYFCNFDIDVVIKNKLINLLDTNKQVFLTLSKMGYPAFGGGENWLLDVMDIMSNGYQCVMICFYDSINKCYFEKNNVIILKNFIVIQLSYIYDIQIVKIIKFLNPFIIHHQGLEREYFMNIAISLNIPFVTGFCFWNDIIEFNNNYSNVNILNNNKLQKSNNFQNIINNCNSYVSSEFVNDVVYKLHNIKLNIIDTISVNQHYHVNNIDPQYLTIINIHYLKGGWLLPKLLSNLKTDITICLIDTEHNNKKFTFKLMNFIKYRNNKFKNKVIYINKKINITEIYSKTKLLLIPSLVDESFCKVAYEGMYNKIPILSTKNGNLKYLLNGYADFLSENYNEWIFKIDNVLNDDKYLSMMKKRSIKIYDNYNFYITKQITNIKKFNYDKIKNNIGIFAPWADQGLGIQAREYYLQLINKGYNVSIFSPKSYYSTVNNPLSQTNSNEWNYNNIYYCKNERINIDLKDIVEFISLYKISSMIFIETCMEKFFKVVNVFKICGVKTIGIPNIEIIKYDEIYMHNVFDVLLCNNYFTLDIIKNITENIVVDYLGFNINHPFFNDLTIYDLNNNNINFYCIGGYNTVYRKHIDKIINIFENNNFGNHIFLHVFIQGLCDLTTTCKNIFIHNKNYSYENIVNIHKQYDIFIHFGSHEGLGLGFYEATVCNKPVITIDTFPNNEIIINEQNGWLINSTKYTLTDNKKSIIFGDLFDSNDFINKLHYIINNFDKKSSFCNIKKFNNTHLNFNYIDNLIKHL